MPVRSMAKRALAASLFVASIVFCGCYTVRTPFLTDSFSPSCDYVILGRVTARTQFMQSGYALLREQAARLYPEADDVIHVQIDSKQNIVVFLLIKSYKYELSGLAVRYVDSVRTSATPMLTAPSALEKSDDP